MKLVTRINLKLTGGPARIQARLVGCRFGLSCE